MFDHKILQSVMNSKGVKAADISRITGIPKNSLGRYISGISKPKTNRILLIASALGVSVEALFAKQVPAKNLLATPTTQINFCPCCGVNIQGIV